MAVEEVCFSAILGRYVALNIMFCTSVGVLH
jgi:hypothetical protein